MRLSRRALFGAGTSLAMAAVRPVSAGATRDYWPTNGWKRRRPELHGLDPGLLDQADLAIRQSMPDVTALLVVRDGLLLFERYYGERYGRDDPVKIRSITKSIVSALIGIALADGSIPNLDSTIGELIPDRLPASADPLTSSITLRHLLTMTSGWAWDIGSDYPTLIASDDWVALTLGLPVASEPGTVFAYNSGGSHLLSVILTAVTGIDTAAFAQRRLFAPLGIAQPTWQRSPQNEAIGGFGLELTPQDLAKFGFLYLNNGEWDGVQLVPSSWVAASTSYQATGDSTGYAAYGYQWWVTEVAGLPACFGLGFGSQYLYLVPALDLIVVVAHGFDATPPAITPSRPLIEGNIVPAVVR